MTVPDTSVKVETALLVPVLAALPVCACMAILGLPAFGHGYAAAFRTLYFAACLAWLMPLALLQRAMWRRAWPWPRMALVLLALSYAMSVFNNLLGQRLAISLRLEKGYDWADLFRGLDGCWLALITFCAVHGVVPYLMLQPLVENAIRHGIAPLAAPGRLDIRVERAGAQLVVEVWNDGQPPAQRGSGIGLANVRERLRHLYGDQQQVEAGWHADGRFGVRIALPLRSLEAAA
ncbi:hypothetical protein MasN3_05830 [Massilia varians]|uniref:Histidine kinase/HSP90-like ATPase domain-containing protein n=1 Tax=Massilia varians TaxID=457921 RepID=A0ABN6T8L7_9BURK|nr:ATP-binding protein [Massilia varians]BDT57089.1 hypothetical protein MasN3_05830 [Massilia varians]